MLSRCCKLNLSRIGLKNDVSDAHRTFKVHRMDYGSQACMLEDVLFINQAGTQGIASSTYWWARLFGLISRLVFYLMHDEDFWVLTYADEQDFMASGPNAIANIVLSSVFMSALRVPFSWNKALVGLLTNGSATLRSLVASKSEVLSPADWLVKLIDLKLTTDRITGKETSDVLGRFDFAASAVVITEPFLGPIYMWAASVPEFALMKAPILIKSFSSSSRRSTVSPTCS